MRAALLALAIAAWSPAAAAPLTVRVGEDMLFSIDHGQPVRVRKADPSAKPARGEVKVSVRSFSGTMMTVINNSAQGYTFKAELIGTGGKAVNARTCTLPPGNQPTLESWPQKAAAVRIGDFKPANGGRC
jgi:hypothetical protein